MARSLYLLLALVSLSSQASIQGDNSAGELIIDCYPRNGANAAECAQRGCIWLEQGTQGVPWCQFPDGYGYSVTETTTTANGELVKLQRKAGQTSIYGGDIDQVHLQVEFVTESIVHLKFFDPNNARYEVPILKDTPSRTSSNDLYMVSYSQSPNFGVVVTRKSTGVPVFNTAVTGFIFADQFLQITTTLATPYIYGFGENRHQRYSHDLNWRTWPLFSLDNPPYGIWQADDNLYGVHPFYLNLDGNGNANGVLLINSNAMEYILQPYPAVTYRTIGGILDFYVFLGPTPEAVVEQYSSLRGKPPIPPYWGLGFQLSRYGFTNTDDVRQVIDRNRAAGIPYETQVVDIDYMIRKMAFTLSPDFAELPQIVDDLHAHNQKFYMIIDPGIANNPGMAYPPVEEGLVQDVFVKDSQGNNIVGEVWPGTTYFPDFSNPATEAWWRDQFADFYNIIKYDTAWIDMNEPASFVEGSTTGCAVNNLNYPPYPPRIQGSQDGKLFHKTLCMDAQQYAGLHYDVHSLYGHHMSQQTNSAFKTLFPNARPFILTRSQFVGTGRYTVHWLGDNNSSWMSIRAAIPAILEYNLFGIPMVGADICGFNENTTPELCTRWMQVGAFYPFARNHNAIGCIDQDPASFGTDSTVVAASIKALNDRYRLLPYLYTLLYHAETKGSTVARPLLHEFPLDSNTFDISFQFLWGPALLITPVVDEFAVSVSGYFPTAARWYDYYTGALLNTANGQATISAALEGNIPLHVRGGYIIPIQDPSVTTTESRLNPTGVIVALDGNQAASGSLFWDDGISQDTISSGNYDEYSFTYSGNNLDISLVHDGYAGPTLTFDNVIVFGLAADTEVFTVNSKPIPPENFTYDRVGKTLRATRLGLLLGSQM